MSSKHVIIGQLGASQGLKGWQRIRSFAEPEENLFHYQPWQICVNKQWQVRELEAYKRQGKYWLVKLKGCDDCETAKLLTNAKIAVEREQLAQLDEDEFYLGDLEGLKVTNQEGVTLGHIDHVMQTGANDLLVIKGEREYLIPLDFERFVTEIDLDKGCLVVNWDADF